jgi:hypothetical protein
MELHFNEQKATQAAALFLKLTGGTSNYMVLIKDLYLAERKSLLVRGRSITNDQFYSMKLGPVLSNVLSLITEMPDPEEGNFWSRYISSPTNYEVHLLADPGTGKLSEAEEEIIAQTYQEFQDFQTQPFAFSDYLHSILPEWERIQSGRSPISVRSVLASVNKSANEINEIEDEIQAVDFAKNSFGFKE